MLLQHSLLTCVLILITLSSNHLFIVQCEQLDVSAVLFATFPSSTWPVVETQSMFIDLYYKF